MQWMVHRAFCAVVVALCAEEYEEGQHELEVLGLTTGVHLRVVLCCYRACCFV